MTTRRLSDRLTVAGQITAGDIDALAAAGVTAIVNNRPDGEEPGQMSAADSARLAAAKGIAYHHIPVTGATLTRDAVMRFGAALDAADGQVLAHCRSGTRSTILYVLSEALHGRMSRDEIMVFGREHGFDLSAAVAWLAREGIG